MQGGAATRPGAARAGARVLALLSNPLHVKILRAHRSGPLRNAELTERADWPAQTTMRTAVDKLRAEGLLERREVSQLPYGVATELTEAGHEVVLVSDVVERWLAKAPRGPIPIDSAKGRSAIKSLASGWTARMVRVLVQQPTSLTELARLIPEMSYPSLERRLMQMRNTHLIEPAPSEGRGVPFQPTEWLRHSIAPLSAAGRCERRHMKERTAPITAVEIEAAFLLTIQLVPIPESASGSCTLSVLPEAGENGEEEPSAAGVSIEIEQGNVVRCGPELVEHPSTWALGKPADWLDAVIEGRLEGLRFSGTQAQMAADLVNGLHLTLFHR